MPGNAENCKPIVRFFGVTMNGNSVLCHAHGFVPYLYVPAKVPNITQEYCEKFRSDLNAMILTEVKNPNVTMVSLCFIF